MTVFKETYEVVGAAFIRAQEFAKERASAFDAQWATVKALGAAGFRPGHNGELRSLLFDKTAKVPAGLRKVGTDNNRNEYRPSLNTKAGKDIARTMSAVPEVEGWGKFANTFGWKGRMPLDTEGGRGKIYFCSGARVEKPTERVFLTYPRELDDGWTPPSGLNLVRESDMLRAIEDHNAAIKTKAAA